MDLGYAMRGGDDQVVPTWSAAIEVEVQRRATWLVRDAFDTMTSVGVNPLSRRLTRLGGHGRVCLGNALSCSCFIIIARSIRRN